MAFEEIDWDHAYPVDLADGTHLTVRPGGNDVPVAFSAGRSEQGGLTVEFLYSSAFAEPVEQTRISDVNVSVGKQSRRLNRVSVPFSGDVAELSRHVASAMRELRRNAERGGQKVNYLVAERGLDLDDDGSKPPPAWLREVLGSSRSCL